MASATFTHNGQIDRGTVERIVREIVLKQATGSPAEPELVVSISARHIHLTDAHVEQLFGPGAVLTEGRPLYQDGFYAAEQTLMVIGPRK